MLSRVAALQYPPHYCAFETLLCLRLWLHPTYIVSHTGTSPYLLMASCHILPTSHCQRYVHLKTTESESLPPRYNEYISEIVTSKLINYIRRSDKEEIAPTNSSEVGSYRQNKVV